MFQQQVQFEWRVGEEKRAGSLTLPPLLPRLKMSATLSTPHSSLAPPAGWTIDGPVVPSHLVTTNELRLLVRALRDLLLLALGFVLVAGVPVQPAHQEYLRVERGITQTLTREEQAWRNKDRALFLALIDKQLETHWEWDWRDYWTLDPQQVQEFGVQIRHIKTEQPLAQKPLAQVELLINRPSVKWWRSNPYRETRFYRETEAGWLRTVPDADYWGPLRTLETEHLRFEFHAREAQVIAPMVSHLEQIYQELYRMAGWQPPTDEKATYALLPDRSTGWNWARNRVAFTSPALSEVPDGLTDAEFVAQMFVSSMTNQVIYGNGSGNRRRFLNRWEMLVWALNGWLRTDLLDQRSPWHLQAETIFQRSLADNLPLRLADVTTWPMEDQTAQERIMRQYMHTESIITYAMNHYGRDRLPALLEAFTKSLSWEELIPQVFGVSVEQFEVGWNQYVAQTYGNEL